MSKRSKQSTPPTEAFKRDVDVLLRLDTHLGYVSFASKYGIQIIKSEKLDTGTRVKLSCMIYVSAKLGHEYIPTAQQEAKLLETLANAS